MEGYIESIDGHVISGWCFEKKNPLSPVLISIYIDKQKVAEQLANSYRRDLKPHVHPTGECAFGVQLPSTIEYNGQLLEIFANDEKVSTHFVSLVKKSGAELISKVQIYGERCSGTNYLQELLTKNISPLSHTNEYGWKHFFPPKSFSNSEQCLFIVIYRDSFDWLRSFYLQPHHVHQSIRKLSFSKFIRSEWHCVYDEQSNTHPTEELYMQEMMFERDPNTGNRFQNILSMRSSKINALESLKEKVNYVEYVRYEELKKNPEQFIQHLIEKYNLPTYQKFEDIITYKGNTQEVFKQKKYFDLKKADLKFIAENLDLQLERQIGYHLEKRMNELPCKKISYDFIIHLKRVLTN